MGHGPKTYQRSHAAWIKGLRNNDPAVVRELYAAHFHTVKHYVLNNSGTPDDAQDIFQEALTVLWLKAKEGRVQDNGHADLGGYLFQVARNKWLDKLRTPAHKRMHMVVDEQTTLAEQADEDGLEERIARLRHVYAKLDERCRTVLDLFYYERKDLAAIAKRMGVSEESIRTIKYRCMMKLRSFRRMIDPSADDSQPQ